MPEFVIEWGRDALVKMGRDLARATVRTHELLGQVLWGEVKKESPFDHGRLAGSWQLENAGLFQTIYSAVTYAWYVYTGTEPHVIERRTARALRFETGGDVVFATRVNHPGTKPNLYIDRAIDTTMQRREELVDRALRDVFLV